MTFNLDHFVADCVKLIEQPDSQATIRELAESAVSDYSAVVNELGEPIEAGLVPLYHAENLTILNITWAPGMILYPHNHCMWANIAIYGGKEENNFYRRDPDGQIVQCGQSMLEERSVAPLHEDVIHSVRNPADKLTAAIHIYGGDFFNAPRSEWDMETLTESPYNIENTRATFAAANEAMRKAQSAS